MARQRKQAEEPKVEEIKNINRNLATELEAYKKREVQQSKLKDEVAYELTVLGEQLVRTSESLCVCVCVPLVILFTSLAVFSCSFSRKK
jgi:hypothetical protein